MFIAEGEGARGSAAAHQRLDPCPLCGGTLRQLFAARDYRRPDDTHTYQVAWCDACRYGCVMPKLTPQEVHALYDVAYYTHADEGAASHKPTLAERVRTRLAWTRDEGADFMPSELGRCEGCALDIGCGHGVSMRKFVQAGFTAVGVEPDPAARRVAVDAHVGDIYEGTGECLPAQLQGRHFDVVLLSHVLEHCLEPAGVLRNVHELLQDDGTLVIEVPNNEVLGFSRFGAAWPWTDVPRHLHFFTPNSLRLLIEAAGFEVKWTMFLGFTRHFKHDWISNQAQIWSQIGDPATRPPDFDAAAWTTLARTLFSAPARKYDSMRFHAVKRLHH